MSSVPQFSMALLGAIATLGREPHAAGTAGLPVSVLQWYNIREDWCWGMRRSANGAANGLFMKIRQACWLDSPRYMVGVCRQHVCDETEELSPEGERNM